MGQKTNPIGLRIPLNKDWRSRWYASKSEFSKLLVEDAKIRQFLKTKLESASVPRINIERAGARCRVTILTARPGLVIGRKGAEIDKMKEELSKMTNKEVYVEIQEIKKHMKEAEKLPTLYIQRTLRSGQSIKSEGNIVIIGDVNPGAEVIAKGDITVWGVLGGIAQAGSDGNNYSRIRALKLNAIQLRIGEIFARRPDTVNVPYVQKTDSFIPEEARVIRKHIVIYKLHEAS